MNFLDIIFILILIGCIAYSVYRGLVKEVFSLASIAIGYIAAVNYYLPISAYTAKVLNPSISKWVSFIIIFIVVFIAVILIGKLIQMVLNVSVTLTVVDRAAGGIIGAAKGIIILSIVILFLSAIPYTRDYVSKSFASKYIIILNKKLIGSSPIEFVKELRGSVNMDRFISSSKEILKHTDEVSEADRKKLDELIKNRE
jgi:membrane protein required for colicin V production